MWIKILVCLFAGLGAGLGTGFAGMSAAAVIAPMLITFLGVDAYSAVGIALASDVLASAISAFNYGKHKNIDIKNGIVIMISVLLFTILGSYISKLIPNKTMGSFSVVMTLLLGLRFIIKPITKTKESRKNASVKKKFIESIIAGALIGFICGFVGAGGGLMILMILTTVLGYELKTAIGTSVFIMSFTALTGSLSHFFMGSFPDVTLLLLCMAFTFIFAQIASKFANKAQPKTLNRVTGIVLVILGIVMIIMKYI